MAAHYTAFLDRVAAAGFGRPAPGPVAPGRDETVARLDALATLLDTAFVIPGTTIRFGIDGLIGLVPGIGDFIATALSSYLIWEARRLGLPRWKIARMMANVAVQAVVGLVPMVGDAADVLFRANRRNMRIIKDHIAAEDRRRSGVVDAEFRVVEPRR